MFDMAEERRSLFGRFGGAAPEAGQQETTTLPRSISGSTPAFMTSSSAQLVNNPEVAGTAFVNDVQQNRLTRRTHRAEPRQVFVGTSSVSDNPRNASTYVIFSRDCLP